MPDLSAYLDIDIELDFVNSKIKVTDVSNYPVGVENDIIGIISTTQPDGVLVTGDWANPDISYSGSLNVGEVELRLNADQSPQSGEYSVTYTVDHPSYTPTTITKTFTPGYSRPTVSISESFDVFTPQLSVSDDSDYSVGGFDAPTVTRAWEATIGTLGTITGSLSTLDLNWLSNYYDAEYDIELITDLTYQHSTYSYLTISDQRSGTLQTTANTPPEFSVLQGYLKTIKGRFDALESCARTQSARQDYEYAQALLTQINYRMCQTDLVGLETQIQDFINVYNGHVSTEYVNTNSIITTYDYTDCNCSTNSGDVTELELRLYPQSLTYNADTSYTIPAGLLLEMIVIYPTGNLSALKIGTTPGGDELYPEMAYDQNVAQVILIHKYAVTNTTIYFTGITSNTTIKYYRR